MSSIGDILQLKLNEKIKIPVHKLNLPGLRTSVHPVLVMNQIQSLYSNVVPEKRMIPQNQSWHSSESCQTNDTNELEPKKQARHHYIVPMHKMSYIEILHRVQLEQNLSFLLQQEQFFGNMKVGDNNTILRGGFPMVKQHKRAYSLDQRMPTQESVPHLETSQLQSNFENASVGESQQNVELSASHQLNFEPGRQEVRKLPELRSYLNRKGTRFGSSPRKLHEEQHQSPGPAEYQISRFGEKEKQTSPKLSARVSTMKQGIFQELKLKSKQFLPEMKQEFREKEKKVVEHSKPAKRGESMIDRFGHPVYPISLKMASPGPQDYGNANFGSIESKVRRIQQENSIKDEIKDWVRRNQRQS